MTRFIEGDSREQGTLFPESLDEYVTEDNPVRVIDAFVDELNLGELGFNRVEPSFTGRPAYHPATLLKIYVYGYLNRIQSSRRLEREAQRNVELMWLTGRLTPDFKTIADFRKDNGKAIIQVCREFIMLCRQLALFTEAVVAIDGSKFKAVNSGDKNFTPVRMKRRRERIEKHITEYLNELAKADQQTPRPPTRKTDDLQDKIAKLKQEMKRLKKLDAEMMATDDKQLSLTDPDARVMATTRKNSGVVGYNVQTAVDTKHHLIVAHEVTNRVTDRNQLTPMAKKARQEMGTQKLTILADRGYFSGWDILACQEAGMKAYVPKPLTSGSKGAGRFTKQDFRYDKKRDVYRCPAGETLIWRFAAEEKGKTIHKYWSSNCPNCTMKKQCTTGPFRRISRWEHEAIIDEMEAAMDKDPKKMSIRRRTVEHPFGTLKHWMGSTHFLTKRLKGVSTEMALHVLAYNMKRVINIVGINPLIKAIQA